MSLRIKITLMGSIMFLFFSPFSWSLEKLSEEDLLPPVFEYKVENRRDPFSSLIVEEKKVKPKKTLPEVVKKAEPRIVTQSDYKLVGIVWDKKESLAIIEKGEKTWLVKEGSLVNSFRVARIEGKKGEVILWGTNEIIQLKFAGREK